MATDKTARPKRKLDLSPQTVGVLSNPEIDDMQAGVQSTNQTKQASCGGFQQDREQQKPVPPAPAGPVKRP